MTDAINFFQSLFSLNSFAPAVINRHEAKLIRALIKDAKMLVETAESETRHGATAQNLMLETQNDKTLRQNMATIAMWHFERSLEKYQKAAARYNEAGKIQTRNSRIFFAEAKEMAKCADAAEAKIEALNNLSAQN